MAWGIRIRGPRVEVALVVVEMQAIVGTSNELAGGSAFASSSYASMPPSCAFDGNTSTYWQDSGSLSEDYCGYLAPGNLPEIEVVRIFGLAGDGFENKNYNFVNASIEVSANTTSGADGTWVTLLSGVSVAQGVWNEWRVADAQKDAWGNCPSRRSCLVFPPR